MLLKYTLDFFFPKFHLTKPICKQIPVENVPISFRMGESRCAVVLRCSRTLDCHPHSAELLGYFKRMLKSH